MPLVYVGLGANLGDRAQNIERALERLRAAPGVAVLGVSQLRPTRPVGMPPSPPQPDFLNGVAKIETTWTPREFLGLLKQIEREGGRDLRAPRHSARPIDLDVLLWDNERIDTRDLVVPHPLIRDREFVMTPLEELGVVTRELKLPDRLALVHGVEELAALCSNWLRGGCVTGLVPTMGALHEGHASLMRYARKLCDRVVVTIFVNPLQFSEQADLARYPRTLEADLEICRREGVETVFAPEAKAMYPHGFASRLATSPLGDELEGRSRPGHFAGVATIVAKLFAIARPTCAFFGRKDAQQCAIIRAMTRDLGFPVQLHECATVRDGDGLAMSSRNRFLTLEDRVAASVLIRGLVAGKHAYAAGQREPARVLAAARAVIEREPRARLDYLELRAEGDLSVPPPGPMSGGRLLVAGWFGPAERQVRLIDNLSLDEPDPVIKA